MSYTKLNFKTGEAPALNAPNMNHLEDGINTAHELIAELSIGESPQGNFTPTAGTEYPSTPLEGQSWYISGVDSNGYLYVAGDLIGLTANNMDKIIYASTGWALIENNANAVVPNLAISKREPVFSLVTNNSINVVNGKGGATFERVQTTPDSTTVVNRYDELVTLDNDEPAIGKYGLKLESQATQRVADNRNYLEWGVVQTTYSSTTVIKNFTIHKMIPNINTGAGDTNGVMPVGLVGYDNGDIYTQQMVIKHEGIDVVRLRRSNASQNILTMATIDLLNGVILSSAEVLGGNVKMTALGSGLFFVTMTFSMTATGTSNYGYQIQNDVLADGIGGIGIGHYQIEKGSIATSEIHNTSTTIALTRSRETLDADPRNFPSIVSGVTIHQRWYSDDWSLNGWSAGRVLFMCGDGNLDRVQISILNGLLEGFTKSPTQYVASYQLTTEKEIDIKLVLTETSNLLYVDGVLVDSITRIGNILLDPPSLLNIGRVYVDDFEANAEHILTDIYDYAMTAEQARL